MLSKVAIIYLCWNNLRHLPDVVASWERLDYPKDRLMIIFLPAHSPDGIADVIMRDVLPRSGKDLPEMVMIDEENLGFSANNNVGIRHALAEGAEYVFLQNGDLKLDAHAMTALVERAESDQHIGAVQAFVCMWHRPDIVNTTGVMIHVAGYGYARDNGKNVSEVHVKNGEEIPYASGAAVLYRASALGHVGLLEEGFVMYHDDLELGLRLRIAGYRNVIATDAIAFHDYVFGRNPKKFAWMELYRWVVLLSYYKIGTLIVLSPLLFAIEVGSWFLHIRGATARVKLWAYRQWLRPETWRMALRIRARAKRLRVVPDRTLLAFVTGRIDAQETKSFFMDRVVNPVVDALWRGIRRLIVW